MALSQYVHIWRPNDSGKTFLLLHGTGGNESDLVPFAQMVDPAANILSLRGNSHEEGVNRFFRRNGEGILDEADIRTKSRELNGFLGDAYAEYGISADETIGIGYSNGANILASLLMLYPAVLRGAVLIRPMAPFRKAPDPAGTIGPTLVLAGVRDSIIPPPLTAQLIQDLGARGSQVSVVRQNAGHEFVRNDLTEASAWIENLIQD